MGVVGLDCVAVMGCGTKKVENNEFSATVSNAQRKQEQLFRNVCGETPV